MSWTRADDFDDEGNYCPGPTRTYPRHARCQPGCCTGTPLCHNPEGDTMTDQTIPAGLTRDQAQAVREWAERSYAAKVQDETMYHAARVLLAVLPKRPTLADMNQAERAACQWMQADVDGLSERGVIIDPLWTGKLGRVMWPGGGTDSAATERITPRPDLPRMEWPAGDQEADQ